MKDRQRKCRRQWGGEKQRPQITVKVVIDYINNSSRSNSSEYSDSGCTQISGITLGDKFLMRLMYLFLD